MILSEQLLLELKMELKNINEKIDVYKSGTCPTCDTKLNDKEHKHNLEDIENQKEYVYFLLLYRKGFQKY